MTEKEINIAIAKACGWTNFELEKHPATEYQWGLFKGERHIVPDYCNDLNAMHEAERHLGPAKATHSSYWWELHNLVCGEVDGPLDWTDLRATGHATAQQRAEAFLKGNHQTPRKQKKQG